MSHTTPNTPNTPISSQVKRICLLYKGINLGDGTITTFSFPKDANRDLGFITSIIASLNNNPHKYGIVYYMDDSCITEITADTPTDTTDTIIRAIKD